MLSLLGPNVPFMLDPNKYSHQHALHVRSNVLTTMFSGTLIYIVSAVLEINAPQIAGSVQHKI